MKKIAALSLAALSLSLVLTGCGSKEGGETTTGSTTSTTTGASEKVSGSISIDGSSTVSPIMEAIAEEIRTEHPDIQATVAVSGTGGGFKKFVAGEIDIAMASRPIEQDEIDKAKANGIEFIELPVAFDGLSLVVNPKNTFVDKLTVEELKKIWSPDSKVNNWSQVRAGFPNLPIKLYGAGTDSGTFDYFTLAINGEEGASRTDYQASEDDNVLVQGVAGDEGALGYFGYAYFDQNREKLKIVPVDGGKGAVEPNPQSISDGTYQPLSRPLLIYINKKAADTNPAVAALITFLTAKGSEIVGSTGYIPLPAELLTLVQQHFDEKKTGSRFAGAQVGLGLKEIITSQSGG